MLSLRAALHRCLGLTDFSSIRESLFQLPNGFSGPLELRPQLEYIESKGVLPHPFLSRLTTNMHEDSSATDVVSSGGFSTASRLIDQDYLDYFGSGSGRLGMLPTLGFTSDQRIIAIGAKASTTTSWRLSRRVGRWLGGIITGSGVPIEIRGTGWKEFSVLLLNPETLEIQQEVQLPRSIARQSTINVNLNPVNPVLTETLYDFIRSIWGWNEHRLYEDTSGGAYFMLDNRNRAIVPTSDKSIWIVWFPSMGIPQRIVIDIPELADDDSLVGVGPVWQFEDHYWFSSRKGVVGIASIERGVISSYRMPEADDVDDKDDNVINNSFAIGSDGLFVASTHAMYRFNFDPEAESDILIWRELYNRGSERKCGQLPPRGSGTTPTLLGQRFVAICDNARNMNLHVFERSSGRTTAIEQVFPTLDTGGSMPNGESACDNSIVAYKFTLFVGNTYCYRDPFESNPTGGLTRIDIDPISGSANRVWTQSDITIWSAVPKYSSTTNLLYIYAREEIDGARWWNIKGIDRDGNTRVSIPAHEEEIVEGIDITIAGIELRDVKVDRYDNGWGPLYIRSEPSGASSVLIGMTQGLYRLRLSD